MGIFSAIKTWFSTPAVIYITEKADYEQWEAPDSVRQSITTWMNTLIQERQLTILHADKVEFIAIAIRLYNAAVRKNHPVVVALFCAQAQLWYDPKIVNDYSPRINPKYDGNAIFLMVHSALYTYQDFHGEIKL